VSAQASIAKSANSPLSYPAFRVLWLASTFSNVGTFVQDVAQAWLMLEITKSAVWVALITVCFTAPSFLFSIPAGVIADRVDRRRMLVLGQSLAAAAALALSFARFLGHAGSGAILAAALGIGFASAINNPPWSSLVPDLVPKRLLPEAIAFNSVSFNVARVLGPALGGYLLGLTGPAFAFFFNGLSFLAVVFVLAFEKEIARISAARSEPTHEESGVAAMLTGFRLVYLERDLRACALSAMTFTVAGAAVMSVLPVFVKQELKMDASGYGSVIGALGVGAVVGAFVMRHARPRIPARLYAPLSMTIYALGILATAIAPSIWTTRVAFLFAGVGWVGVYSTLHALVQTHAPEQAKTRVVAIYGVSWLGVWIVAALAAGAIAKAKGATMALTFAGCWALIAALATMKLRLPSFKA
jgi:MFS family permease